MTHGHYYRTKPRVNVLRGYTGNEPQSRTRSAKPKDDEGIKSGMIVSIDGNGEWIKGAPAGKIPHVAFHDQSDTDVQSSKLLLAFSCAGQFEIETAYFDSEVNYVDDMPLTADTAGNAGNVTEGTPGTDDILGFVSRGGLQDVTTTNSQAAASGSPPSLKTLTFVTQWSPAQ